MKRKTTPNDFETRFFNDATIQRVWAQSTLYNAREVALEVIRSQPSARPENISRAIAAVERAPTLGKLLAVCTNYWHATDGRKLT
jgi:hypothetical protein